MGSLTSSPKVVSRYDTTPKVIYVQHPVQPTPPPVTTTQAQNTGTVKTTTQTDTGSGVEGKAERKENLLQRDRSRFGTVTTSFRGLLQLAGQNSQRKTLLGE